MRPVRQIDPAFFAADEPLGERLPLLDRWLEQGRASSTLGDVTLLMVQHQLSNQVPMLRALLDLGVPPERVWWLDIPYTSHAAVRDYVAERFGVPRSQMTSLEYSVLSPYGPYQHARMVKMLRAVAEQQPRELLILDDGAYALEALAALAPQRWPKRLAVVEQTTRGFIKWRQSAALRRVASELPVVDVARSEPKRTLEPPFIGMAVCAALVPHLKRHFADGLAGRALVLGYGAIGEQVATFLREHFALRGDRVTVFDPQAENQAKAERRGFARWQRDDFSTQFALVVGCSGDASFAVGDYIYLEKGALLASASSGAVELSRQGFIEMADASGDDDLWIERAELDERNVHSDLKIHLVDRDATFVNAGFPVNFDGRLTVCPSHFIQPTPTMMVAAATQAVDALRTGRRGIVDLDTKFSAWVDREFRALLGDRVEWLLPVPESAW